MFFFVEYSCAFSELLDDQIASYVLLQISHFARIYLCQPYSLTTTRWSSLTELSLVVIIC